MYFDKSGPDNTGETARIAVREAKERLISHIVAASNTGATVLVLAEEARKQGYEGRLVCVTHVYGFREGGTNELSDEGRENRVEIFGELFSGRKSERALPVRGRAV